MHTRRTIFSITFIIVSLFVIDRLGGYVMFWVNQNTQDQTAPKFKYIANEIREDVVIIGTSRCAHHYVSSILSDSLGMSVYNAGIDASDNIFSHYCVLNMILKHHTPKVICLELTRNDYAKMPTNALETISFFAPYFGQYDEVDNMFRLSGNYWPYRISHLYRFNAKAVSNIGGLIINRQGGSDNGYVPIPKPTYTLEEPIKIRTIHNIDEQKVEYIQKFINKCKERNIQLVFQISPGYMMAGQDTYDVLKSIANKNDVPFLDYLSTGLFLDHPEYFKDTHHLCHQGALLYTSIFAHDLKKIL